MNDTPPRMAKSGTASEPTFALLRNAQALTQPVDLPFSLVNPELADAAHEAAPLTTAISALSPSTLAQVRAMIGQVPDFAISPAVVCQSIPGAPGAPDVAVYVINSRSDGLRPAILHTHGGGFVLGTAASDVRRLQGIAEALDCVIVSVEYRLAPEVTYQSSIDDNYAALSWLFKNASTLGIDPRKVAVMGESAGGGHAALLAITTRDRGEFSLAFQLLTYPMLDDRTGSARHVPAHIGHIFWTAEANRFGWWSFLGQEPGTASVPTAAVPARVENLSGLPPTFIAVGSIDLFVEENITYARRLIDAGVPTELLVVPGGFHGFDSGSPEAAVVRQFNGAKLDALRKAFGESRS